jgi:hypothetical protein
VRIDKPAQVLQRLFHITVVLVSRIDRISQCNHVLVIGPERKNTNQAADNCQGKKVPRLNRSQSGPNVVQGLFIHRFYR